MESRSCNFSYTRLPKGPFIRLLHVQPAETFNNPIICSTRLVSLDDTTAMRYAALSYTWGDQKEQHSIVCDGCEVKIGSNLKHALWRFRQLKTWQFIWADAICINQADNDEKSAQIPLMRRIYQQAAMTYVYIGEQGDQPITPNAIEALEKWILKPARSLKYQKIPLSKLMSFLHDHKDQNADDLLGQILESSPFPREREYSAWMAWQILLARPWFNRVWVIQEATASRRTVFQIGSFRISRDELMAANIASFTRLSGSTANVGFPVVGGYPVAGQTLDATNVIWRWRANRVNLEIIRELGSLANEDGLEKLLRGRSQYRSFSPIGGTRLYDLTPDHQSSSASSDSLSPRPSRQNSMLDLDKVDELVVENDSESSSTTSSAPEDAQKAQSGSDDESSSECSDQERSEDPTTAVMPVLDHESARRRPNRHHRSRVLPGSRKRAMSTATESSDESGAENDWNTRIQLTERIRSRHMFQLMKKCCRFESTVPKDRLYGLLGIASDEGMLPRPDYSKTDDEVYQEFAEYFIMQGYGIELLSMLESAGSPSWVPNFAGIGENVPGHAEGWSQRHFLKFQAGGPGPGEARLLDGKLLVQGLVVHDEVQLLGPPLRPPGYFSQTHAKTRLQRWEEHVTEWDQENIDLIEKECGAGRLGKDRGVASMTQLYNITISADNESVHQHKTGSLIAEFDMSTYHLGTPTKRRGQVVEEQRDWIIDTAQGRRICVTGEGRMGLVPTATERGDFFCLFSGASAPFVARKYAAGVVLLGDSYVHGLMQGQGFGKEGGRVENILII